METDFLVIGAGVAGLRAAIELAGAGRVLVVAKERLDESSSQYAQGGIAAALNDDDEIALHEQDTLIAGDGLCDPEAVRTLVAEGPEAIRELISWGMQFDRDGDALSFGHEGAHSRRRILHAGGDSTGREMSRALFHKANSLPSVQFRSFAAVTGLVVDGGAVTGAMVWDKRAKHPVPIHAKATLLATGGMGHVFLETTNPPVATGDGAAVAWRAGAEIADIEFVQFHPTVLHWKDAPRFLLSEALRGEGALLLNKHGERFMSRYDSREELAPRDVVSRAIVSEMRGTHSADVWLDLSHRGEEFIARRFPRIFQTCLALGINLGEQPAPVCPAVHYAMGGVRTGLWGETNLDRLYAAGEVAATGMHGANRLASNSLLEGLVFGARAGRAMKEWATAPVPAQGAGDDPTFRSAEAIVIQTIAWEKCGIVRTGAELREALQDLEAIPVKQPEAPRPEDYRISNLHLVATLIARAAFAREESRGAHYRADYREKWGEALHSVQRVNGTVEFVLSLAPASAAQ